MTEFKEELKNVNKQKDYMMDYLLSVILYTNAITNEQQYH